MSVVERTWNIFPKAPMITVPCIDFMFLAKIPKLQIGFTLQNIELLQTFFIANAPFKTYIPVIQFEQV